MLIRFTCEMKLDYILSILTQFGTVFLLHKPAAPIPPSPPPPSSLRIQADKCTMDSQATTFEREIMGDRHKFK